MVNTKPPAKVTKVSEVPIETAQVLATCHSLAHLDDGLVGDPLEKATLSAVDWTLTRADAVIPKRGRSAAMKIFHRHHFTSALKRMSVVAGYAAPGGGNDTIYVATVKGAPETLRPMFDNLPAGYDEAYLELSRRGARVLALGRKDLGMLSPQQARALTRDDLERNLVFCGLVVISCPLKSDSKAVIHEIVNASHRVVMITGDGALTACHVAKELDFFPKQATPVLVTVQMNEKWYWQSIDQQVEMSVGNLNPKEVSSGK